MIILHGVYRLRDRIIAYRNDFCLTCAMPTLAVCRRTFYVAYVYYIPILPLGFWKLWRCTKCERDPHVYPGENNVRLKWAGLGAVAIFSFVAWRVPEQDVFVWIARVGLPIMFGAGLWKTLHPKTDSRLRQQLMIIQPADEVKCGVCGGLLIVGDKRSCLNCQAERAVLSV